MTVNQLTGTVSFSLPLAAIQTPTGLGEAVSLSYSSKIVKSVTTWNREEPTDVAGLGWKLSRTYIMRQPLHTGDADSDGYALVQDGAATHRLMLTSKSVAGNVATRNYSCDPHEAWIVTRRTSVDGGNRLAADQWTIIQGNGETLSFGGPITSGMDGNYTSSGNAIEWEVTWNGFSLPSRRVWIDQEKMTQRAQMQEPLVWNLQSRADVHGWTLAYG